MSVERTNQVAALAPENHVTSRNPYPRRIAYGLVAALYALGLAGCGNSDDTERAEVSEVNIVTSEPPAPIPDAYDLSALTFSDDPTILQVAEPLQSSDESKKLDPKGVTLHWWSFDSGGDIEGLREALAGNKSCGDQGCAVQYAVTKDGSIYRMMESPTEYASHAKGANNTTFGIEIEGKAKDFEIYGPNFNRAKFEAVVSLTRELVNDFDLPIKGEAKCQDVSGIHGHHEYNHCGDGKGTKTDVGDEYTAAVINAVESMSPIK